MKCVYQPTVILWGLILYWSQPSRVNRICFAAPWLPVFRYAKIWKAIDYWGRVRGRVQKNGSQTSCVFLFFLNSSRVRIPSRAFFNWRKRSEKESESTRRSPPPQGWRPGPNALAAPTAVGCAGADPPVSCFFYLQKKRVWKHEKENACQRRSRFIGTSAVFVDPVGRMPRTCITAAFVIWLAS